MTITADDVRRLLEDENADAVLVLVEGRTEVIAQAETDSSTSERSRSISPRS